MNILVIDDNEYTSMAIADYCCMNNISCQEVNNGKKGLCEIQKQEYDVITLDIAMPEFTGLDILSQLNKRGIFNQNIIILTATNMELKDLKTYRELGVRGVIHKPISLIQLDRIVNRMNILNPLLDNKISN
ncbi:MAG: response regulator [Candidatus Nitrosocosmicus sp.]